MDTVLTLVVTPHDGELLREIEAKTLAYLNSSVTGTFERTVLSENEAIDLAFDGTDKAQEIHRDIPGLLSNVKIDWCLQSIKNRKKKLLLADMDSTIITVECIDELADFAGIKDKVSEVTEAAMRGEIDFIGALESRVALLKDLPESALKRCFDERVKLTEGARTLIQTMKSNGAYTALVSGGFTFFTSRIQVITGFDMHRSNELEIIDGLLTGKVVPPICDAGTKLESLKQLKNDLKLSVEQIVAIGDGANDIPMIDAAGLGVAFHAKEKTQNAADTAINHTSLETLLFYQGFRRSEFIS